MCTAHFLWFNSFPPTASFLGNLDMTGQWPRGDGPQEREQGPYNARWTRKTWKEMDLSTSLWPLHVTLIHKEFFGHNGNIRAVTEMEIKNMMKGSQQATADKQGQKTQQETKSTPASGTMPRRMQREQAWVGPGFLFGAQGLGLLPCMVME